MSKSTLDIRAAHFRSIISSMGINEFNNIINQVLYRLLSKTFKEEYDAYREKVTAGKFWMKKDIPGHNTVVKKIDDEMEAILVSDKSVSQKLESLEAILTEQRKFLIDNKITGLIVAIEDDWLRVKAINERIKQSSEKKAIVETAASPPPNPNQPKVMKEKETVTPSITTQYNASQKPSTLKVQNDLSFTEPPPTRKRHS